MAKEFILPEFSLRHEEKKKLEEEYFGGYEAVNRVLEGFRLAEGKF